MQLTFEQIKSVTQGAARILQTDGVVQFRRFTQGQEAVYQVATDNLSQQTLCTAGIKLQFRTSSTWLELEVEVAKSTPYRTYFSFDVFSDESCVGHLHNFPGQVLSETAIYNRYELGIFHGRFLLGSGEKTLTVHFPWSVAVLLRSICLEDDASVIPVRPAKTLLTFGDSITQGYDAMYPSNRYGTALAEWLNAEEFCRAIGGEEFCPALAKEKEAFAPDYISVAYGTNDWNNRERADFRQSCRAFFEVLSRNYPKAQIFALTPLWRKDWEEQKPFGCFDLVAQDLAEIVSDMPQVSVIRCYDLIPKEPAYFTDLRLHPNDRGFRLYANGLISAVQNILR